MDEFEALALAAAAKKRRGESGGYDHSAAMKARIEAAKAGTLQADPATLQRAQEMTGKAEAALTLDAFPSGAGTISKVVQGFPFVGEWVDEGLDYVNPGHGERVRQVQGAMDTLHPKTALAAEIGGGVLGSIPLAVGAVGNAMGAGTKAGTVARGMGWGIAGGGLEGGLAGAGRAKPGERMAGAEQGAMFGAGIGGAVGGLAPIVGHGAKAMWQRVKKLDVSTIVDEFGMSPKAARIIKSYLVNDDLNSAAKRLAEIGDDAMLADAGAATRRALDTAGASGGEALRIMRERVGERAGEQGRRLNKTLDRLLGPADGVKAAASDIAKRTAGVREKAYTRAYGQAINYADDAGRAIEGVLARVPSRTLKAAVQEANDAMQAAGVKNAQIMAQIADDGSVVFKEMPNVQQLDYIKRALGDIAQKEVDQFGRKTGAGIRAGKLAGDLRDALGRAVPSYKAAVRLGGDKIAEDNALDMGKRLLLKSTTFEDAANALRGASVEAKAAAKRGLREHIENTLSNVRRTLTDPDTDAREAMQLIKEMSSRANIKKVRLVLGGQSEAFFRQLDKAEAALTLRAAVAENSKTAQRIAGKAQMDAEAGPGLVRRTLGKGGNPLDAMREVTESAAGIDPASMSANQQALYAEVADRLTGIRGKEAQRALAAVQRAMSGQPMKDAEAELVGRVLGGSVGSLGHQAAMQSLAP